MQFYNKKAKKQYKVEVLKLSGSQTFGISESPGGLVKTNCQVTTPEMDSVGLRWSLRMPISTRFQVMLMLGSRNYTLRTTALVQ